MARESSKENEYFSVSAWEPASSGFELVMLFYFLVRQFTQDCIETPWALITDRTQQYSSLSPNLSEPKTRAPSSRGRLL